VSVKAFSVQIVAEPKANDDLLPIGRAIHREKYRFKQREGFDLDQLRIPGRILETPTLVQGWDENYLILVMDCVKEALASG
jgi:hypothetical protein